MIEYYSKFFSKNYYSKIKQLILDIERILVLEKIKIIDSDEIVLNDNFKRELKLQDWLKINRLYNTLYSFKGELPLVLNKFINKTDKNELLKYKFIDTFAGCGGLSLGLEQVGFNPILINEIEPKFLESYYFNRDINIENYYCSDIKLLVQDFENNNLEIQDLDLVVGGPPCQGFSMANRQRIIDDPRNELYRYYLKLLELTRPKTFIMENVKGMMNKSNEIKENFESVLGKEYSIEIILLNAKDFGIPQNRERVFVIGSRIKGVLSQSIINDILSEKASFKKTTLKDALDGLPTLKPKTEKNTKGIENDNIGYKFRLLEKSITNEYLGRINQEKVSRYCYNHVNRYNNERDIEIYKRLPQGANSLHESISDIMPYKSRNHIFKDKYFKLREDEVSKTITSHMKFDCNMYIHPRDYRGLSPREAARIQSFPDDFVFMGANNNWYAQIGNAVPVQLAKVIGKHIIKHLK